MGQGAGLVGPGHGVMEACMGTAPCGGMHGNRNRPLWGGGHAWLPPNPKMSPQQMTLT